MKHWKALFNIYPLKHWKRPSEHWQYKNSNKFQQELAQHRTTWSCVVMSTQTVHYFLWVMVYRVQEPLVSQSPHRNRSSGVGGWGNVIRPTRCTDQGTSYCFTNLLLPHRLFLGVGGAYQNLLNEPPVSDWRHTGPLLPGLDTWGHQCARPQQHTHSQV